MKKLPAALILLVLISSCIQQNFKGIPLSPANPAPDFTLINQFGEKASLSDFRGKVVVMSFLYTNCPTVCPVITSKFVSAAKELAGSDTIFVVVTVDPEIDTVERINEYSASKGMLNKWQYLTGEKSAVEKVWRDYGIFVNKSGEDTPPRNYFVDHTTVAMVIDRRGDFRLVFPGLNWSPEDLAHDVQLLMKE